MIPTLVCTPRCLRNPAHAVAVTTARRGRLRRERFAFEALLCPRPGGPSCLPARRSAALAASPELGRAPPFSRPGPRAHDGRARTSAARAARDGQDRSHTERPTHAGPCVGRCAEINQRVRIFYCGETGVNLHARHRGAAVLGTASRRRRGSSAPSAGAVPGTTSRRRRRAPEFDFRTGRLARWCGSSRTTAAAVARRRRPSACRTRR